MPTNYNVQFTKEALKYFNKLDRRTQKRIAQVIEELKMNPQVLPNIKPMEGLPYEQYRIRIGNLRIVYRVNNRQLLIIVVKIGPRGDVYKK